MYWIVFAPYTVMETAADLTAVWFPTYNRQKILFIIWVFSLYSKE